MPTPVARRTRSSRRSSVLDKTVVDEEVIITPARSAPRTRLSRARGKQAPRMATRRSSRRSTHREGESEAESDSEQEREEEEERQREGGREGEASPTKKAAEEEEEAAFIDKVGEEQLVEKGGDAEEGEEEQEEEEEEEDLAETESELEETESELEETELEEEEETEQAGEEDIARYKEELQRTVAARAEAMVRTPPTRATVTSAGVVYETLPKIQTLTPSQEEMEAERMKDVSQSSAVMALLVFCTIALLATSGLLLYIAAGPHGWGDGSAVTAMWSEDSLAFLTDQRIAATVQKDIATVETALRTQMAELVASQVNGKTSKTDGRVAALSTELETLLSHVTQIQAQVEEYRRAAAAAAAAAQPDNAAPSAALERLETSQSLLEQKLQQLEAKVSGLKAASSVTADQQESLEAVHAQLSSLSGRLGVLQEAAGDVEALRSDMSRLLLEKQRQHDELVARYTREMDALLAEVDGAKKDSTSATSAISDLTRSLEELSVPEMHAIEERVRVIVTAELAKQPVVKPGLERDHVQELINAALAKESANREEPLTQADVERLVEKQLSYIDVELAALKHAAETKAAAPPPPVISVTEEASADIVEGERMRIMAWVQEAIDKARLAPAAQAPAAPPPVAQAPPPYVRPEEVNLEEIKKAVMEDVYKLLFADAVGKPDYALASAGGSVVDYSGKWSLGRLAGMLSPFPGRSVSAQTIIEKDTSLGACWPMAGSSGFVTVKLAQRVLVDSVSIEHVSSTIAHNQESAPRDVRFWGYSTSGSKAMFLGQFAYDINGREVQTFPVQSDTEIAVSLVKMEVLSNHGHPDYTCIYRLRVHGSPVELQL